MASRSIYDQFRSVRFVSGCVLAAFTIGACATDSSSTDADTGSSRDRTPDARERDTRGEGDTTDNSDGTLGDASDGASTDVMDEASISDGNSSEDTNSGNDAETAAVCGNGALEPGEACDDGNLVEGDGCTSTCDVPAGALCAACATDDDCGAAEDLCITVGTGSFCGQNCMVTACPEGYVCETIRERDPAKRQCKPVVGYCGACPDEDSDGVCDDVSECPGPDGDRDGVPDSCDDCPLDPGDDTDNDSICDSFDKCPGSDDLADADGDTKPNACDPCALDNPDDSDGDSVCDSDDRCEGSPDSVDVDGDGTPDGCDTAVENCTNRTDDDGDSAIDCDDTDCARNRACVPAEDCGNGSDDDLDGLTDCGDSDCSATAACASACDAQIATLGRTPGTVAPGTETSSCGILEHDQRLFEFTPATNGAFCARALGGALDTLISSRVRCDDPRSETACNDDYDFFVNFDAAVTFTGTAGVPHYLLVEVFSTFSGNSVTLEVTEGTCESGGGGSDGDTYGTCANPFAIDAYGEYGGAAPTVDSFNSDLCFADGPDMVFAFTPPDSGAVCVDTLGADYDTVLYARSECEVESSELACNDDFGFDSWSAITLNVTAGETVYLILDAYSFATGNGAIAFTPGPCPL